MDPKTLVVGRRKFLRLVGSASIAGGGVLLPPIWAEPDGHFFGRELSSVDPELSGRPLVRYPEKTDLILLTSRPPQLETPMKYFDRAITPNEAFYVRYHVFPIPTLIGRSTWRLKVTGHVQRELELSIEDLNSKFPAVRVVAVNQCSGNSRSRLLPRVFGGQWGNGAMGNAEWVGAPLRDVLNRAGLRPGAAEVTFNGLDEPASPSVPDFVKSLKVPRIMEDPDIIVACQMNGEPLPMLNGFPARLVVPGWYAAYWVKHLSEITVIDHKFEGFWMKKAYRIPDTPCGCIEPGTTPSRTVPINRMNVRSFITTPKSGVHAPAGQPMSLRGIAFDGGYGVAQVLISSDRGASWQRATLGKDLGRYSFREWTASWTPPRPGTYQLMVRAANSVGETQPLRPLWNPSGYLYNRVEHIEVIATY